MREDDDFTDAQESIAAGCSLLVLGWNDLSEQRRRIVLRVLCESLAELEQPVPRWIVALYRNRLTSTN